VNIMDSMRRIIVGVAIGASLLTGGVIGATIAGPLVASAATSPSASATAASPGVGSGTFVPNENAQHEAGESAAREAQEMQASSRPFRSATMDEGPDAPAPPLYQRKLLIACGFAAPIVFVATFLIEGATRPGYDAWAEFVSLLSLGSDGWMQVANFIASGWLLLGFSIAVYQAVRIGAAPKPAPIVFSTMGFGLVGAGAFPTDAIDTPLTLHGELHYIATAIVAGSLAVGCLLEWHDGRHDPGRMAYARRLMAAGLASITLFSLSLVIPTVADPGLVERLAFVVGSVGVVLYARRVWPQAPVRPSRNRKGVIATMRDG